MSEGMFNSEQMDHMRALDAIPPERKCWCGWFGKGQCHTCPPDKSSADKLAARCIKCGADPGARNLFPTTHRRGCPRDGLPHREPTATDPQRPAS